MADFIAKRPLFGSEVIFMLHDVDAIIGEVMVNDCYLEGLRLQKVFNIFDPESELSILNRKRSIKASEDLLFVIRKALEACEATDGAYDISLGKMIKHRKSGKELPAIDASYKDIRITDGIVDLKKRDVMIDLGSIAKGFIADKMAEYLISQGVLSGMIDARGDLRIFGDRPMVIGIQDPRDEDAILGEVELKDKSIATSGDYKQFNGSMERSHILNQKELISVTVVADDLMTADIYSTSLFVSDEKGRESLLRDKGSLMTLTVDKARKLRFFNGFEMRPKG